MLVDSNSVERSGNSYKGRRMQIAPRGSERDVGEVRFTCSFPPPRVHRQPALNVRGVVLCGCDIDGRFFGGVRLSQLRGAQKAKTSL